MRLWHKELVKYLPRLQLVSQWRECVSIITKIKQDGTPNHILVNRVLDYPLDHFYTYCHMVQSEMLRRGYKASDKSKSKIWIEVWHYIPNTKLFVNWHNDVYLRESLYNLEEKAICGGIPADEWQIIYDRFKDFTPLWEGKR